MPGFRNDFRGDYRSIARRTICESSPVCRHVKLRCNGDPGLCVDCFIPFSLHCLGWSPEEPAKFAPEVARRLESTHREVTEGRRPWEAQTLMKTRSRICVGFGCLYGL